MKPRSSLWSFIRAYWSMPLGLLAGWLIWKLYVPYPWVFWGFYAANLALLAYCFYRVIPILWRSRNIGKVEPILDEHERLTERYRSGEITREAYLWRSDAIMRRLLAETDRLQLPLPVY